MPRVNGLTADAKIQENLQRITRETAHKLDDAGITYTKVAQAINKTPAAVSRQFQKGNHITLEVWIASNMLLEGKI